MDIATAGAPRLLIVPGLHDSGAAHWQTWLQSGDPDAQRVRQRDWAEPDLDRWADRIGATLDHAGPRTWVAVAHSFGCLALVRHLARDPGCGVVAALLVAPAEPAKFGIESLLPAWPLPVPSTLVGSRTDPWMRAASARAWARRWQARYVDLGDAGHINAESGYGPLPLARRWVQDARQRAVGAVRPRLRGGLLRPEATGRSTGRPGRTAPPPPGH